MILQGCKGDVFLLEALEFIWRPMVLQGCKGEVGELCDVISHLEAYDFTRLQGMCRVTFSIINIW